MYKARIFFQMVLKWIENLYIKLTSLVTRLGANYFEK